MADNYVVSDANLTAIADAIRDNLGTEDTLTFPEDFIDGINGIVGAFHDVTSAPVASFSTDLAAPLKSSVVEIEPVQAGSGDPSPDNVRAISGWSAISISRTEINIWDEQIDIGFYRTTDGQPVSATQYRRSKNKMIVAPGVTLYVTNKTVRTLYYDANDNYISFSIGGGVITTPPNCKYLRFYLLADDYVEGTISINYPRSETVYHSYKGSTYNITLDDGNSQPGTVYGGTLDVVSGLLTVNRKLYTWNAGESGAYLTSTSAYALPKSDVVTINAGNQTTLIGAVCDKLPSGTWASIANGSSSAAGCALGNALAFRIAGYTTSQEYEAFLTDNQLTFAHLVKEPQTYQLTSTQIKALLGENNVWADAGNVAVTFKAKS